MLGARGGRHPRAQVKVKENARNFSVEVICEVGDRGVEVGTHPLVLGLAHLAEPSVLEDGQKPQERDKTQRRFQVDGHASTVEGHHCHSNILRLQCVAASRDFTFLTNSYPRLNHFLVTLR